jgi:hypothetical protein
VHTKNKAVAATASATVSGNEKIVYVTYQGGPDADLVQEVTYTIGDSEKPETLTGEDGSTVYVGAVVSDTTTATEKVHVVVTAHFKDGSSQVILDTFV